MQPKLTRRTFGGLALTTLVLPYLASGAMASTGYAMPDLLISARDLMAKVESATDRPLIVDVRAWDAFREGHIPGAVHLDPNAVVAAQSPIDGALRPLGEIATVLGNIGVSADRKVVLYDDRGGFHAARMFWLLEHYGHQSVALLNGGLQAWMHENGGLSTDAEVMQPATFVPTPAPRRLASADYIMSHRDDADTVVIDVRPATAYADGHIPWAINVPWTGNLGSDGLFLPADDLQAHFTGHGVGPDRNVVIHCQVGLASSHSYVALRLLGYARVRVYHRSWAEWGADPTLPSVGGA